MDRKQSPKNYLGVVGQIACGKEILVDYLIKNLGFTSFSLSSILHDELKKKGTTEFTRKTLQDMGDQLRKKYGREILARKTISRIQNSESRIQNYVIEGIRNPAEIEYLKKLPNFFLIGVKAKKELRFKRLLKRNKPWDPKTWEDFLVVDRRDFGIDQKKEGQQVAECLAYCDFVLVNNKDIADFQRKVKKLFYKLNHCFNKKNHSFF